MRPLRNNRNFMLKFQENKTQRVNELVALVEFGFEHLTLIHFNTFAIKCLIFFTNFVQLQQITIIQALF